MFTTYRWVYILLALLSVAELIGGFIKKFMATPLGTGLHAFLSLFAIIFVIEALTLIRYRNDPPETQARLIYNAHGMTLILGVLLLIILWAFTR